MVTTLMNTPWQKGVMPVLVRLLEHNGATYNVIVEIITTETTVQPVNVQLLLARLVKDAYLNAEEGIYRLNHMKKMINYSKNA